MREYPDVKVGDRVRVLSDGFLGIPNGSRVVGTVRSIEDDPEVTGDPDGVPELNVELERVPPGRLWSFCMCMADEVVLLDHDKE